VLQTRGFSSRRSCRTRWLMRASRQIQPLPMPSCARLPCTHLSALQMPSQGVCLFVLLGEAERRAVLRLCFPEKKEQSSNERGGDRMQHPAMAWKALPSGESLKPLVSETQSRKRSLIVGGDIRAHGHPLSLPCCCWFPDPNHPAVTYGGRCQGDESFLVRVKSEGRGASLAGTQVSGCHMAEKPPQGKLQ